jgi:hypothetical protein
MDDFKGLSRDTTRAKTPQMMWEFARNILLNKNYLSVTNESGFDFIVNIPGQQIGVIDTNEEIVIFSLDETYSYIGTINTRLDNPIYELVLKSTKLGFKLNRPIEGVFYKNYKQDTIIIFSDGNFKDSFSPKLLNITSVSIPLSFTGEVVNSGEEYMELNPKGKESDIFISYEENSTLDAEVCYITYAYVTEDNSTLSYFPVHEVAYPLFGYKRKTTRNIIIDFFALDYLYTKIRIGIVVKRDNALFAYESPIINASLGFKYVLSSLNGFTAISPESLIVPSIIYSRVKTLTLTNDEVFLGNTTTEDIIPFQKYANLLKLDLKFIVKKADDFTNPTLCPDEVYSFYISLELKDGSYSEAFHIPGEVANPDYNELVDLTSSDLNTMGLNDITNKLPLKRFHIINSGGFTTALPTRIPINLTEASMRWGYWQNQETYPNASDYNSTIDYNGGVIPLGVDLRNTPIRYHRVPGLDAIAEKMPIRLGYSDKNQNTVPLNMKSALPAFGVQINNFDAVVPLSIKNHIQGYRLLIVKRNRGDVLVEDNNFLKQAQVLDINPDLTSGTPVPVLNTYHDIYGKSISGSSTIGVVGDTSNFRFDSYSPAEYGFSKVRSSNLSLYRPSLTTMLIKANYVCSDNPFINRANNNEPTYFKNIEESSINGNIGIPGETVIQIPFVGSNITVQGHYLIPPTQKYAVTKEIKYLLGNNSAIDNYLGEESIILTSNNSNAIKHSNSIDTCWNPLNLSNLDNRYFDTDPQTTSLYYYDQATKTYISAPLTRLQTSCLTINVTLLNILKDVYRGFSPNEFITLGKVQLYPRNLPPVTTPVLFDNYGDIFTYNSIDFLFSCVHFVANAGYMTFIQSLVKGLVSASNNSLVYPTTIKELNKAYKYYIEDVEEVNTFDYTIKNFNLDSTKSLNDLIVDISFNINKVFITSFPNRIHRSLSIRNESLSTSAARTYLANNYFETLPERGEIIALRGAAKILYIQKRYSLFIARIKDTLINNNDTTYLGVGDLFDREPDEILEDKNKGFIGCSSQFSCALVKEGLFVVDMEKHKMYLISKGVDEITKKGISNWFIKNSTFNPIYKELSIHNKYNTIDNPYTQVGYLLGYDVDNNRILITKKDFEFLFEQEFLNGDYLFENGFYRLNTVNSKPIPYSDLTYFKETSKTLSYSLEGQGSWICEHDYFPNSYINTAKGLYATKSISTLVSNVITFNLKLFKTNSSNNKGTFFNNKFESYVDLIFNSRTDLMKLYQSTTWNTLVKSTDGSNKYYSTIDSIIIYNDFQCSGRIEISGNKDISRDRNVEGNWNFNDFRDLVVDKTLPVVDVEGVIQLNNINNNKSWFEKSNFISNFIVVRLIMKNLTNDEVIINNVNVKSRTSDR